MKTLYNTLLLLIFILITSCGGSGGDDPNEATPVPNPSVATLLFPEDKKECTEGIVVNETQSTVNFQWTASENTDSYEVKLTNLNTNTSSTSTSNTNEKTISLQRGTPYEWFVISKASGTNETATSAKFRFYNQGAGVENYAPFPAEAINPKRGSTIETGTTVTLQWSGADVDNDIESYEVFFGTETEPTTSLGTLTTNTVNATISSNLVYYWQVVTTDQKQNKSRSEVFQFKVQ
ncbi:hypothetical protein [Cellulophaga sp. Hel_I_12]|uniref:hypothetical protein n=1 Tax=Cellulophaga sp. Hel_I_12 TaxID=1249972 RepID=UPI000646CD07|nr:hypothetical protein [Cellulophaga sp. Hel_I_12]